jgi:hypothetical protein
MRRIYALACRAMNFAGTTAYVTQDLSMRASDTYTESLFAMSTLEDFIPQSHPLRPIRKMVNEASAHLVGLLTSMYAAQSQGGRSAIAPEKLLRAMLL